VNCSPGHIQCNYSISYAGINIRLNVSVLLLEIIGHIDERYTANFAPNTAQFFSLRCLNRGPGHIQCNYSYTYSGFNIQQNVAPLLLEIYPQFNERYTANLEPNITHIPQFTLCELCGPGHIRCNYSSAYSAFNIQLKLPAQLLEICRHLDARYTATMVPYIAHILQFSLCEQGSRTYTMYLQLRIFRPQYSTERICAAIGDITTIQCALYCKLGAKCSAHPPVYAM
jgi:hypothetical protein